MTTSTLEVGDLFVFGAQRIELPLRLAAGVDGVSVNPIAGPMTVTYNPDKTSLCALQAAIKRLPPTGNG